MVEIAAVIITFNPNISTLENNICSVINQVKTVLIIDNNSNNISEIRNSIQTIPNVKLIVLDKNKGIATATNVGINYFYKKQFNWVLVLDQDSLFPSNGVQIYKDTFKHLRHLSIGMLAPVYIELKKNEGLDSHNDLSPENLWEIVDFPIASGSLVSIPVWKLVGGYDESLFIDRVDDDFDLRIRQKGFKLIQVNSINLNHMIGDIRVKRMFGKIITIYNHNAFRKYYQARNNVIFAKKHKGYTDALKREVSLMVKTILFEDDKLKKIASIAKGIYAGILFKTSVDITEE